ncbi:MAG: S8 family serine peptidase [Gaiellales bacterium]
MTLTTGSTATAATPGHTALVYMQEHADLSQQARMPRGAERRQATWDQLVATAERTQAPLQQLIDELIADQKVESARSIPLINAIAVTLTSPAGDSSSNAVLDALRGASAVASVVTDADLSVPEPARDAAAGVSQVTRPVTGAGTALPGATRNTVQPDAGVAWGVAKIGAPAAWSTGITGKGVTVGLVDSGLDASHEGVKAAYRGTQADGSQQHDYNWIDTAGYDNGDFVPVPYDSDGHGTHVAGTVAGGTDTHKIGVAPDAKFIVAKMGAENYLADAISAVRALQFMLAPTKVDGTAPDPSKGVDIVNNSWGIDKHYRPAVQGALDALKAAGIVVVNAAGNEGEAGVQGTVQDVPGSLPGHLSVAATTRRDKVPEWSSVGPSPFNDKVGDTPTLAAPGDQILSAEIAGGYAAYGGTSVAAPHVTGAVALMLQANPQATNEQIRDALQSTATDIDRRGPDYASGAGRINADQAVDAIRALAHTRAEATQAQRVRHN